MMSWMKHNSLLTNSILFKQLHFLNETKIENDSKYLKIFIKVHRTNIVTYMYKVKQIYSIKVMIFFESQGDFRRAIQHIYNSIGYEQNKRINKGIFLLRNWSKSRDFIHCEAGKQELELLTKLCNSTLLLQWRPGHFWCSVHCLVKVCTAW